MKTRIWTVLVSLLLVAAASGASSDNPALALRETTDVGTSALATLRKLATEANYAALGFRSAAEAGEAKLGAPVPVAVVTVADLQKYQAGDSPDALLASLPKVIFPVLVGDAVRSSITVEKMNGKLSATGFGSPKLIQAFEQVRRRASGPEVSLVHVNLINSYFVGYRDAGKLMLASLVDLPELGLVAGQPRAAADVFGILAPLSLRYNGLPM